MKFIKRYFKCIIQRKLLLIVLLVIGFAIGLISAYKIYNPSHEYYTFSFECESIKEINIDSYNKTKQTITQKRDNSKYIVLNNYMYEVGSATSVEYNENKYLITINYEDKKEEVYGTLKKDIFKKDDKNYILIDDYYLYLYNGSVKSDGNYIIYTDGSLELKYEATSNLEYLYPYSSFDYVNTKKLNKTSYIKTEGDTNVLYVQQRYFNSWQQARRFMATFVSLNTINPSYLLTDTKTSSLNTAISKAVIPSVGGTNIYVWSIVGMSAMLVVDLIVVLVLVLIKKEEAIDKLEYDNENIFKTPFHKKYWTSQFKCFKSLKDVVFLSLLLAMMQIVRLIPLPSGFGNLGISLSAFFFAIIGLIYGPCVGFVIGVISDIFGFFVFPDGYPFHIGYVFQAALTGFVYGIMFYKTKLTYSKALFARLIINILLNAVLGSILWADVTNLSNDALKTYFLTLSLPKNVVYLIPQSVIMYLIFKALAPAFKALNIIDPRICDDINHTNKNIDDIIEKSEL